MCRGKFHGDSDCIYKMSNEKVSNKEVIFYTID